MKQFSEEEARAISGSRVWTEWTDVQILQLQLFQNHLCVPFSKYHSALERCLGRPVYTHTIEFNKQKLVKEFLSIANTLPSEELMKLIPKDILNQHSSHSTSSTNTDIQPNFLSWIF